MGFWGKVGGIAGMAGGTALMFVPGAQLAGLGLIGAGAGMAKHEFDDIPKEQSQMKLAAETEKYAPWTGLHGKMPERSSGIGSALQGGTTGLMLGQGLSSAGLLSNAPKALASAGASTAAGPNLGISGVDYGGAASLPTPNLGYQQSFQGFGNFGDSGIPVLQQPQGLGDVSWSKLLKDKYSTL
jgi:hypothetical protein